MSDLLTYLKAENAKKQEWMDAGPDRWTGMYSLELASYHEEGVFTVEDFQRQDMLNTMSDLAKAAYGTRRACPDTDGMSFKELSETYDSMLVVLDETQREEEAYQARMVEEFEKSVTSTMAMGGVDRETAVRWLREAEDDETCLYDDDYFCYHNGLPYGYLEVAA